MDDSNADEIPEESIRATEWWWIDYLENEMDPVCERDLELLLAHSEEDRDSFEAFRLLREWVKASDPVKLWPVPVEERLRRVRANVMQALVQIEQTEPTEHIKQTEPIEKRASYLEDAKVATKSLSV